MFIVELIKLTISSFCNTPPREFLGDFAPATRLQLFASKEPCNA